MMMIMLHRGICRIPKKPNHPLLGQPLITTNIIIKEEHYLNRYAEKWTRMGGKSRFFHYSAHQQQQQQQKQQDDANVNTKRSTNVVPPRHPPLVLDWKQLELLLHERYISMNQQSQPQQQPLHENDEYQLLQKEQKQQQLFNIFQSLFKQVNYFFKFYGHETYEYQFKELNRIVTTMLHVFNKHPNLPLIVTSQYLIDICEVLNLVDVAENIFSHVHQNTNLTLDYRSYEHMVSLYTRANRDIDAWEFTQRCHKANLLTDSRAGYGYLRVFLPLYMSLKIHTILSEKELSSTSSSKKAVAGDRQNLFLSDEMIHNSTDNVNNHVNIDNEDEYNAAIQQQQPLSDPAIYADTLYDLELFLQRQNMLSGMIHYSRYYDESLSPSSKQLQKELFILCPPKNRIKGVRYIDEADDNSKYINRMGSSDHLHDLDQQLYPRDLSEMPQQMKQLYNIFKSTLSHLGSEYNEDEEGDDKYDLDWDGPEYEDDYHLYK